MSLTDKQIAGNQRRTLRAMQARLLRMADDWDGLDEFNRTQLTDLADLAEKVAAEMIDDDPAAACR